jgi:hypothetical protein
MALFGRGKTAAPAPVAAALAVTPAPASVPPPATPIIITALDTVTVQIWAENADHTYGKILLADTALAGGETRSVLKSGPVYVQASAGEKIAIDIAGKRILPGAHGVKGNQAFELP